MIGKETFHKISVVFLYLFFVLSPFSISLCQILAGASLFFLFLECLQKREFPKFGPQIIFWILLYLSFLFTPVFDWDQTNWKQTIFRSEFGDVWMAFLLLHHSRLSYREKTKLKQAVRFGAVFLLLSGILSLVSPYRLAPFVMDGFQYTEGRRLPHLLVILWEKLSLYLPIGFQSTHLTYGGLLAIYLPSIWERTFRSFQITRIKTNSIFYLVGFLILSLVGFILLFLNQSRSIWFGLLFGILLLSFEKKLQIKKYIPTISLGILGIAGILFVLYQNNWLFQRAIDDLFAKRSLENQRVWIHKMNFAIIKENYLFGIGSGNYPKEFITQATPLVKELPELYYDLSITPKSHAHFDFLHFWILGGLTSIVAYLSFLYWITKGILQVGKSNLFYLGFFSIIFAGSFQCYLLDDEVLLPFLGLLILLPSTSIGKKEGKKNFIQKFQNKVYGILFFWILISSLGALYLTKTPAKDLFFHRTRTEHNFPMALAQSAINAKTSMPMPKGTHEIYFKLSGCLDHEMNFDTIPKVRVSPIQFFIHWDEIPDGHLPETLILEIRKRESFDQDKEYKVQAERIVKKDSFINPKQIQKIQVHPKEYLESLGRGIEFVDFGFLFSWQGENPFLPRIEISGNCD